jgi:hypothetical protein
MSLADILQIEKERIIRERVVLTTVYERMKNRINLAVKATSKECIYTIPEFIPGYPLIDPIKTSVYLISRLKKEGFIALQINSFQIYITWNPEELRKLDQRLRQTSQKESLEERRIVREKDDFIQTLINSKKNDNIFG